MHVRSVQGTRSVARAVTPQQLAVFRKVGRARRRRRLRAVVTDVRSSANPTRPAVGMSG